MTVATGRVVGDPSGRPLRGVAVNLYPWTPCKIEHIAGLRSISCPKAVASTTTDADGTFRLRARPGHYLLAVGSDDPNDLVHPTVHDDVTLAGTSQHLVAPGPCPGTPPQRAGVHCLPSIPLASATGVERGGDYRLATLDGHEVPCAKAFDAARTALKLEPAVVDEWLTENTRAFVSWRVNPNLKTFRTFASLSTGQLEVVGGGSKRVDGESPCGYYLIESTVFSTAFPSIEKYALDPRTHWIGARWVMFNPANGDRQGIGYAQYPRDPRNFQDPRVRYWP
jgi:hypothetical protein